MNILLVILLVILIAGFCYYGPLLSARKKIGDAFDEFKKYQDEQKKILNREKESFALQCATENRKIEEQRNQLIKQFQNSAYTFQLAHQIREKAQAQVNELQQQVNQLQAELYNARKRASRIAKHSKKAQNIP